MALDKISNVISNVIKPFQIAIVGTISYDNVMINTIIDLKTWCSCITRSL